MPLIRRRVSTSTPKRQLFRIVLLIIAVVVDLVISGVAQAEDAPKPVPVSESASKMTVPKGFNVSLFAGEPDVVQPMAFTLDDRGRLWVVESMTYPAWITDGSSGHDRIVIFEDTDNDGRFDSKKLFWDKGTNIAGIEYGFGGIWLCATPNFLFIPDRDRNDTPDGPPVVLLDGWDLKARHNVFNGLTWGPDGWLYGCNGILSNSSVGKPGTPEEDRKKFNCGVWRYHPTQHVFEVFAWGFTNAWGLDFNEHGQMFITNCVIKHVFHVMPGGHYTRMFGQDVNPNTYGLIESCADHIHWGGGKWTTSRGGQGVHDKPGGGHAHVGCMIYQADNWPKEYRNRLFTCNVHGNRVNQDVLKRYGSGYVASHGKDFLFANDTWFRGLELKYGPDGGVYVTDWSDTGECHDHTVAETERGTGRIYKVTFGKPAAPSIGDLTKLSSLELAKLQRHSNKWYADHARRILQERSVRRRTDNSGVKYLEELLRSEMPGRLRLRALWTLHAMGQLRPELLNLLLDDQNDAVRGWCVRLLADSSKLPPETIAAFQQHAASDDSATVRLELASALQRIPVADRLDIAIALAGHKDDANDAHLPLMIWYGIEAAVPKNRNAALQLVTKSQIPLVRQFVARRLAAARE